MKRPHLVIAVFLFAIVVTGQAVETFAQKPTAAKPKPVAKTKSKAVKLSTALPANTQSNDFDKALLIAINDLRANPSPYISQLEAMKPGFNGKKMKRSNGIDLVTTEGVAAVNDAIAFLKLPKKLKNFNLSHGLSQAANVHVRDMIANNTSGHKGSDGSLPPARVSRFGHWDGAVKENISYHALSVKDVVLNMLIDDGNPKRDHRKNLLSPDLKFIGVASGENARFGRICILVFTGAFTEK
jgi:uncharacterized protein YkwD